MDFSDQIKQFSARVETLIGNILTEEATKTSLIMPFFSLLGYDIFNPQEFVPEYTADVGIKKGEKVDYAIMFDGKPVILIEAKWVGEKLDKHDSQLFRYFGTTEAKFAILTNGQYYKFFTDLDEANKMDTTPFLEIDILNYTDNQIAELKKFCKENFDIERISNTASELKYLNLIKNVLAGEFSNPSDDFIRYMLNSGVYEGVKTQSIVEKYRPIIKKALSQYINELVNDKIQLALNHSDEAVSEANENVGEASAPDEDPASSSIITTQEEIEAYFIIKSIVAKIVNLDLISYKDTVNYFSVLYNNKTTKWICRLYLREKSKYIHILVGDKIEKYSLNTINDIYNYSELIINRTNEFLK